jgi:hypothetical protein
MIKVCIDLVFGIYQTRCDLNFWMPVELEAPMHTNDTL